MQNLSLELELLAVEYQHQKQMEVQRKKKQLVHIIKENNHLKFSQFTNSLNQTAKKYFMIGVPVWIGSTVLTKSLFIFPTIINVLGYMIFSKVTKNKTNS